MDDWTTRRNIQGFLTFFCLTALRKKGVYCIWTSSDALFVVYTLVSPGNARPSTPSETPSPRNALRVGTPISCWETESPPTVTVSNPAGPRRDSPDPYRTKNVTLGKGLNVGESAGLNCAGPKSHVAAGTAVPLRSKQLNPSCTTQVSELSLV